MIEKKNIDRLFQEKFKDFEALPDEQIWENIEAELNKKKKRRVIPFWFRFAGAAAVLILAGLLAYKLAVSGDDIKGKIVHDETVPVKNHDLQKENSTDKHENPADNLILIPSERKTGEGVVSDNPAEGNAHENNGVDDIRSNPSAIDPSSDKPSPIQVNKGSRIKSTTSIAETDKILKQKLPRKATNRSGLHLLEKDRNFQDETAIAEVPERRGKEEKNRNSDGGELQNSSTRSLEKSSVEPAKLQQSSEIQIADDEKRNPDQNSNIGEKPIDKKPIENISGIAITDIKKDSAAIATAAPNALEELLNEKENNVTAKEQKVNRWQITSNIAPIYFSSTSNGSPLDSRFESNKKSYAPSVSYGIGAKYAIGKKFFIKTGVNSVAFEYNTNDVIFFQTENARRIKNVTPNMQGSLIQVDNKPQAGVATLDRTIRQFNGDLNQRINYLEIPMELSYQILNRKFGIEFIGGLSTMVLDKNEVSLVSSGMEMNIGKADNLNRLHFSTNLGVGFKYSFLKRFEANLEPMFKYQINTFTQDSGNFKPYFFGLYTGVSYRF